MHDDNLDNDDVASDGEDWSRPGDLEEETCQRGQNVRPSNLTSKQAPAGGYASGKQLQQRGQIPPQIPRGGDHGLLVSKLGHTRTIIHIDIDCFYAQVEMLRDPSLRTKPLGIQQKYIVVTSNYVAREKGVGKLMGIKEAKEKCPDLVLVSGEDLTHYREMSYKISEFLQKYTPNVERLGFDENYLDVSEMVEQRFALKDYTDTVTGFLYGQEQSMCTGHPTCPCGCHLRLAVGSQIASDIREALHLELGITCCAGVAHNKLLSKLVAGAHKPNKQTTLFPEDAPRLLASLDKARMIPGIGWNTSKKLGEAGIHSVQDVQDCEMKTLVDECGPATAAVIKQLSHGIDESPVVTYSMPQTISDEDSFKKCSTVGDAQHKIEELLHSLLKRLKEDGRTPHTLRLTVRKFAANRGYSSSRESRQCPIPSHVLQKMAKGDITATHRQLTQTTLTLFEKLINVKEPFHLTLINVAFAKLEVKSSNDIASFFSISNSKDSVQSKDNRETPSKDVSNEQESAENHKSQASSVNHGQNGPAGNSLLGFFRKKHVSREVPETSDISSSSNPENSETLIIRERDPVSQSSCDLDLSLSKESMLNRSSGKSVTSKNLEVHDHPTLLNHKQEVTDMTDIENDNSSALVVSSSVQESENNCEPSSSNPGLLLPSDIDIEKENTSVHNTKDVQESEDHFEPLSSNPGPLLPSGIDPEVFSQLPPELQEDILGDFRSTRSRNYGSDTPKSSQKDRKGESTRKRRSNHGNSKRPVVHDQVQDAQGVNLKPKAQIEKTSEKSSTSQSSHEHCHLEESPFRKKKRLFTPKNHEKNQDVNNNGKPESVSRNFVSEAGESNNQDCAIEEDVLCRTPSITSHPHDPVTFHSTVSPKSTDPPSTNTHHRQTASSLTKISSPSPKKPPNLSSNTSSSICISKSLTVSTEEISSIITTKPSSSTNSISKCPTPRIFSTDNPNRQESSSASTSSSSTSRFSISSPMSHCQVMRTHVESNSQISVTSSKSLPEYPTWPMDHTSPTSSSSKSVPMDKLECDDMKAKSEFESQFSMSPSKLDIENTNAKLISVPQFSMSTLESVPMDCEDTNAQSDSKLPFSMSKSAPMDCKHTNAQTDFKPPISMSESVPMDDLEPQFRVMTGPSPPVPPDMDESVFRALPVEIQAELSLQWQFQNIRKPVTMVAQKSLDMKRKSPKPSVKKQTKNTTLLNFFRSKDR